MKKGKSLQELAVELDRQNQSKRDFIADTRDLQMVVNGENHAAALAIPTNGDVSRFPVQDFAHSQIAQRVGIPQKYYDTMLSLAPELLAVNVNHWFSNKPEPRMVRTLDGAARAFLSNRYRCLDNFDLAQAVLPVFNDSNTEIEIVSTEITDRRMYIKALFPRIEGEIQRGDAVQSGVVISNSEIGHGSLRVEPLVFRLVCLNGMISSTALKKYHVGRATDDASEGAVEIFRDETLEADDRAFYLKVQDIVRSSINEAHFEREIERIRAAAEVRAEGKPTEVVERVAKKFTLTDGESDGVLEHLIKGNDLSAWGVCNAITRTSQDVLSYDRATELERFGGQVIELAQGRDWNVIGKAA